MAGTITSGFSGDGGPAIAAQIDNPYSLWLTTAGDLYFADYNNQRIRKISSAGIMSSVAGSGPPASFAGDNGPATAAKLNVPGGCYVDTTGKLFIADLLNHRIRLVNTNNIITTFAGTGTSTPFNGDNIPALTANFDGPRDVKGDSNGVIYITDWLNFRIRFVENGIISTLFGTSTGGFTAGISLRSSPIKTPEGIWVDTAANVYFSDGNSIHRGIILYPTSQPTRQPSSRPSREPTARPTEQPSSRPSGQPSMKPTNRPSAQPSRQPSSQPSSQPSFRPSRQPTARPTVQPTGVPSRQPSSRPSSQPTGEPSCQPSMKQSIQPNSHPTTQPSSRPTMQPTSIPTSQPSSQPSRQPSSQPLARPSSQPSCQPTRQPTCQPSNRPSVTPTAQPGARPSSQPSRHPSSQPSTQPTMRPTTQPTSFPSGQPTSLPTSLPSSQPSNQPTDQPSHSPSSQPTMIPTNQPTNQPTYQPTAVPSVQPSTFPSNLPSSEPSRQPSSHPTGQPSRQPSDFPTSQPSSVPSPQPTGFPTNQPSRCPTTQPTTVPSSQPSRQPSAFPSRCPTSQPSEFPSSQPTMIPSNQPTKCPSGQPTVVPSGQPSGQPSALPSSFPSSQPSGSPSSQPTAIPSRQPTVKPSQQPSSLPSTQPTGIPSAQPSSLPTVVPSSQPTSDPTDQPSSLPSGQPTRKPTNQPSVFPTPRPTSQPSCVPTNQPSSSPSSIPSSQPSRVPTAQPFASPTSAPVATIYRTNGVLFWMGTVSDVTQELYDDQNNRTLGTSFILFGRNFNHQNRFPSTITLSVSSSREFVSKINEEGTGGEEPGVRHDITTRSTTIVGDINGDGFLDLLVGYPSVSKCSVYLGNSGSGSANDYSSIIMTATEEESFAIVGDPYDGGGFLGWSSTRIGDVNNDRFDEIIVSAIYANTVYVIYGRRQFTQKELKINELTKNDGFKIIGHPQEINFGVALTLLHDFQKRGRVDLAITAQQSTAGQNVIYVLFGAVLFSNSKTKETDDVEIRKIMNNSTSCLKIITPPFSYAGFSLSGIGDINSDGYDDLAIGSVPYNRARYTEQITYVIYGRKKGTTEYSEFNKNNNTGINELQLAKMTNEDGFTITGAGFLVVGVGDLNNDGIADVLINNYRQWQGKTNSYVMVYPRNMTYSPTFFPSSHPSVVPSRVPSSFPSLITELPTSVPTSLEERTVDQPGSGNTFPPALQRTALPSRAPKTTKPTRIPSMKPSTRSPTLKTDSLSPLPSRKSSAIPTPRPTLCPSSISPSITHLTSYPSSFPSVIPTESLSTPLEEILIDKEGVYTVPRGNGNYIISGEGTFTIKSDNGGEGKKVYTIVPSKQNKKNTIIITDFRQQHDQISLIYFYSLRSIDDVVYRTNPLEIILSPDQSLFLSTVADLSDLTEESFVFRTITKETKKHGFKNLPLDLSVIVFLGLFVGCVGIFGCATNTKSDQKDYEQEQQDIYTDPEKENELENDKKQFCSSSDSDSFRLSSSDSESEVEEENDDDDDEEFGFTEGTEDDEQGGSSANDWNFVSSLKSLFSSSENEENGIDYPLTEVDRYDSRHAQDQEKLENDFYFIQELMEGNHNRKELIDNFSESNDEQDELERLLEVCSDDGDDDDDLLDLEGNHHHHHHHHLKNSSLPESE
jgi:hypothetical protein